ncbi:MAG TPA: hypothetical protein VGS10_22045 [Terracidiphilus sp.]|nr:hypothetical protein [Terracidiphilus sp.]
MQTSPEPVSTPEAGAARLERPVSGLVYQGVTIAAMLWLLASLWAF